MFSGDGSAAISAALDRPFGVAVDPSGNVIIADTYNNRVRKITIATGIITTIAGTGTYSISGDGGAATSATFQYPVAVTLDSSGTQYINFLVTSTDRHTLVTRQHLHC